MGINAEVIRLHGAKLLLALALALTIYGTSSPGQNHGAIAPKWSKVPILVARRAPHRGKSSGRSGTCRKKFAFISSRAWPTATAPSWRWGMTLSLLANGAT